MRVYSRAGYHTRLLDPNHSVLWLQGVKQGVFAAGAVPGFRAIRVCFGVAVRDRSLVCVADTRPRTGLRPGEQAHLRGAALALGSLLPEQAPDFHWDAVRKLSDALRAILNAAPLAIVSMDREGRVQSWNPAAERIFGWSEEEVRGRALPVVPAEKESEFESNRKRVLSGEVISGLQLERRRKDGTNIPVRLYSAPLHDAAGCTVGFMYLVEDITDQVRAEARRRHAEESAARLAAIVQGSQDAIISYGLDGTVESWNPGAEKLYGRPAAQMVGEPWTSFLDEPQAREMREILKAVLAGDAVANRETARSTKDGDPVPIQLTASAVRDGRGQIIGVATIAHDIRDLRKRENEIRIMNRHLQKLSRELLASQDEERRRIARELHDSTAQLLAALTMNLSMMSKRPAVAGDKAARALIEDSLALSERCSQEVRSISYGLHPPLLDELGLISALHAYVEGFSRRSGIAVTMDLAEDLGRLPREIETAIFRIVQECLSNVHRHSGSPTACISLARTAEGIELFVADQGKGVPPGWFEDHANLGVGIPGIRERASQLGGRMDLKAGPNGVTIRVSLPMESQA